MRRRFGIWRRQVMSGAAVALLLGGGLPARAAEVGLLHFPLCSALAPAQRDFAAAASLLDDDPRRSLVRGDDYSGVVLGCAGQVRAKVCAREVVAFAADLYGLHPAAPPSADEAKTAAVTGAGAFALSGGSLGAGLLGAAIGAGGAKILGMAGSAAGASWCIQQQQSLSGSADRVAGTAPTRLARDVDLLYFQQLVMSAVPARLQSAEADQLLAEASRRAAVLQRVFE
jgi:hypothetical protein